MKRMESNKTEQKKTEQKRTEQIVTQQNKQTQRIWNGSETNTTLI